MTDEIDDPRDDEDDDDIMDEDSYDDFEDEDEDDWDDEDDLDDEDDEDEDDSPDEEEQPSALELHIAEKDTMSGTVPVAWCVSKEYLEDLKKRGVKNPQLVICVAPSNRYAPTRETRYVVGLTEMMTYIEFKCSGENVIYGFIQEASHKSVKRDFLCKTRGAYDTTVFFDQDDFWHQGREGTTVEEKLAVRKFDNADLIKVDVPAGVFAPEPPAWEKMWVNHFFRERPHDQCHFRRRRMFAYTIQLLIFAGFFTVRILALLVGLLFAFRGAFQNWKKAFQLLAVDMEDGVKSPFEGGLALWNPHVDLKVKGDADYPTTWAAITFLLRSGWKLIFTPAILIGGFVLFKYLSIQALMTGLYISGGVVLGVFFLLWFFLSLITRGGPGKLLSRALDAIARFVNRFLPEVEEEDINMLVCDGRRKPLSLKELPSKHRTFKLRFQALKSKVCRPFSN